jgi:integrase
LGLRFGEVARLEKKNFNYERKTLSVYRSKTDTTTLFEFLPDFICEKIKDAADDSQTLFIYTVSGNYPKNFYPILKDAVESVGLEYGRAKANGITFHSNRHSFTTRLIQNTDLATAAAFTGHSDKAMLGYYAYASDASKRSAMQNMYNKTTASSTENLMEIFEKVRAGGMNFDKFEACFEGLNFQV